MPEGLRAGVGYREFPIGQAKSVFATHRQNNCYFELPPARRLSVESSHLWGYGRHTTLRPVGEATPIGSQLLSYIGPHPNCPRIGSLGWGPSQPIIREFVEKFSFFTCLISGFAIENKLIQSLKVGTQECTTCLHHNNGFYYHSTFECNQDDVCCMV